jgi:hypothetical protein
MGMEGRGPGADISHAGMCSLAGNGSAATSTLGSQGARAGMPRARCGEPQTRTQLPQERKEMARKLPRVQRGKSNKGRPSHRIAEDWSRQL